MSVEMDCLLSECLSRAALILLRKVDQEDFVQIKQEAKDRAQGSNDQESQDRTEFVVRRSLSRMAKTKRKTDLEFGEESTSNKEESESEEEENWKPMIRSSKLADFEDDKTWGLCSNVFPGHGSLGQHPENHGKIEKYETSVKTLKRNEMLRRHKSKLEEKDARHCCSICAEVFHGRGELHKHETIVHSTKDKEQARKCSVCVRLFTSVSRLKRHAQTHFKEKSLVCDLCGMILRKETSLRVHKAKKHGVGKEGNNTGRHTRIHWTPQDILCHFCGIKFPSRGELGHHKMNHIKAAIFQCDLCKAVLKSSPGLRNHFEVVHMGIPIRNSKNRNIKQRDSELYPMAKVDQTLSCEVCGRKYRSEWQLKEHHGRKHSGLKPHACSLCPKRFPYESFLKAHEVTHTKERNCVCDTCGKAYPTTSGLRRHIGALHPDVEMPQKYIYASLAENIPVLNQSIFEDHESSEEEVAVASIGCENPSQQTYSSDPLALPPTIQTDQPLLLKYRDNMNLIQQTEVKPFTETGNESEPILNVNLHDGPSFSTNESDDDEKFSPGDYESFEERTLYSSASFKTVVSEPQRLVQRLRRVKRSKSRSKELFPDPSLLVPKIKIESEDEEKKVVKYKSKRKVETTVKCRLDGCKFRAADHEELASHRADSHGRTEEVRRYKYKCSVRTCKFKARFPDSLESHRMTVHSESVTTPGQKTYPYTCILSGCGKGFNHRIRLTAHVHQCHKRGSYIVPYNCPKYRYSCTIPDCPNKFNHRQRLTEHLERSHGEKAQTPLPVPAHTQDYIYNCPIPNCTKGFTHRVRLDAHLQNLHGELSQISSQPQSKRYMCTFSNCSQRFDHHYRLEAHLQNFHAENFENVVGDEYKSEIRCRLNGCSFRTKFRSQLKNHRNSVHGISFTRSFTHPCSVEGCKFKGISPWSLAKHEREHREGSSGEKVKESTRKFSCDVPGCGFRSSLLENLQNHHLRVHENKPPTVKYKCTDCEKTFRSHSYMQLHKKMKHSDAAGDIRRQFHVICQICGRELSNKVWLHRHMRRVHPDAPSFSCTFCSKIYYDEEVWKQHVPRHDRYGGSLTPFRCVVTACNQIPLSLMELKTHVGQDHDSGQEPRVMCATCGVTTRQSNLRAHELTHIAYTPFHCPLCPKAFRRDLALEQHRESKHPETLEGEGKYTCSFCEKKFHAKGNLFRHTFLHRSGGKRKPWVRKRKESVKSRQPRKKRAKSEQPIGGADCGKPSQQICYSETAYLNFQRFLSEEVGPYYHHQTLNYM